MNRYLNTDESLKQFEIDKRTNFKKVCDWNNIFGVPVNNKPVMDIFKSDPKLVEYRLALIKEEVAELEEAIKNHDMVETYDALCDILVVVYGAGASFGLDLDKGLHLVNDSNMSKSCKSEQEAIDTVEWYIKNEPRYTCPDYRKAESKDNHYWIVFNKKPFKILKSINWKLVDFDNLLNK